MVSIRGSRSDVQHTDMSRFNVKDQRDKDHLKIVSSNIEDVYDGFEKSGVCR